MHSVRVYSRHYSKFFSEILLEIFWKLLLKNVHDISRNFPKCFWKFYEIILEILRNNPQNYQKFFSKFFKVILKISVIFLKTLEIFLSFFEVFALPAPEALRNIFNILQNGTSRKCPKYSSKYSVIFKHWWYNIQNFMKYFFKLFAIILQIFEIFFKNFGSIPRDSPKYVSKFS